MPCADDGLSLWMERRKMIAVRAVSHADINALHHSLWATKRLCEVEELIERAVVLMKRQRGYGIVVEADHQLIGFGLLTYWSRVAEISDLIVHKNHRSQGIGTQIIHQLIQYAANFQHIEQIEIGAEVSNERAVFLYERLGFKRHRVLQLEFQTGLAPVIYLRQKLIHPQQAYPLKEEA